MTRRVAWSCLVSACLQLAWAASAPAQATEAWAARYNGPGNGNDSARRLALDAAGNVYVTGLSWGSGTSDDFTTAKYDPAGNPLWTVRYDGPGGGYDRGLALALDAAGNVLVTGFAKGLTGGEDITTIKYDSAGQQQWVRLHDGPYHGQDRGMGVAADAAGNVVVTGWSLAAGPPAAFDYATIKYDPAGNVLWTATYNGPANNGDMPFCLALDGAGNVYVAGQSTGVGTAFDYATVKYDASGKELWVARYHGTGNSSDYVYGLVLDGAANVHVTGASFGWPTFEDVVTIKYDTDGNPLWLQRWDGGTSDDDWGQAVALDAQGNVLVTGYSRVDGGGVGHDYATLKYGPQGALLWARRYQGPAAGDDLAWALAVDASGNAWVTGQSPGAGTLQDYATLQYDPDGQLLQELRYDGPGHGDDAAAAIVLDAAGNVYVTGSSAGSGTGADFATIKYAAPQPTWTDLGSGLAGGQGIPLLTGAGSLSAGSAGNLSLASARPSAPALLCVSLASVPVPFKGGVLVAYPFVLTLPLATDAGGALLLPFIWPPGVPPATVLHFQYAVQDAAAPLGVALSNGLKGVTP